MNSFAQDLTYILKVRRGVSTLSSKHSSQHFEMLEVTESQDWCIVITITLKRVSSSYLLKYWSEAIRIRPVFPKFKTVEKSERFAKFNKWKIVDSINLWGKKRKTDEKTSQSCFCIFFFSPHSLLHHIFYKPKLNIYLVFVRAVVFIPNPSKLEM